MAGLSDRQRFFCNEYLIDLNATQAAIRAGYSERTASEQATRLLGKVIIQNYISERQLAMQKRTEVTADKVIAELAKIGFANIKDFVNGGNSVLELKHLESEKTAAVSKVKTTINELTGNITTELTFHDKVSALEKLGRHLGVFEKDNGQRKNEALAPVIQVFNSAPPLPSSEAEIDTERDV